MATLAIRQVLTFSYQSLVNLVIHTHSLTCFVVVFTEQGGFVCEFCDIALHPFFLYNYNKVKVII